jgi:hypothetical protein
MHIPEIRVVLLENKRRGAQNYEIPPGIKQNDPLENGTKH